MAKVDSKKKRNEELTIYEQRFNPSDILSYLPKTFKDKLSLQEKKSIADAFYLVVKGYKERYETKYLDRMLI